MYFTFVVWNEEEASGEKRVMDLLSFFSCQLSFGQVPFSAHTHKHTYPSPTASYTHIKQITHMQISSRHKHTHTNTLSTFIQIIHVFIKGWLRLQNSPCTGPAHAPFNTSEWAIGCANGQCSHLLDRLWTMLHWGGCTTLHTHPTPIRLH